MWACIHDHSLSQSWRTVAQCSAKRLGYLPVIDDSVIAPPLHGMIDLQNRRDSNRAADVVKRLAFSFDSNEKRVMFWGVKVPSR